VIKERLKFLIKDTVLYGVASGVSRFVVFITIPIIVNRISVAEFGIWSLFTMLGSIVSAVLIFGMDSAVVRFYFDDKGDGHRRRIFSHGFYLQLTLSLAFVASAFAIPTLYLDAIGISHDHTVESFVLFSWIPANVLGQFIQNWFKWTFQRTRFLVIALGTAVSNLILLYAIMSLGSLDLRNILFAQSLASWMFVLLGIWWCRRNFTLVLETKMSRELALYGFPMMLVMLVGMLSPALDRLFLVRVLSEQQLGVYSFCQRLSVIMSVVVAAFQTAFGPFAFSIWEKDDARHTFSRFQTYYIIIAGGVALGICCCGKVLTLLLGNEDYLSSVKYLPYLVAGAAVYGLYSFAAMGIFYSKRMIFNLISLSVGLIVTIILDSVLVPVLAEQGAVIAYLSGNVAMVLAAYLFSARFYTVLYSFVRDGALILTIGILLAATNYQFHTDTFVDAAIKLLVFLPGFALVALLFLNSGERAALRLFRFR
jgi:O-antigen/teichoic acid export membrane protein